MEATCMQLSIEGERLLKAGDYNGAIEFFEAGLRVGTDDHEVLSAVYNQLGNACFYVGKFHKALEYHKKDLEIAEKIGDRQGQAKAFGNLGNTFKSLKNYPNAVKCCEAHLEITRELKDRLGEGRACYNLGNVHHALGKAKMAKKGDEAEEGKRSVLKAIEYYKATLVITAELKDTAGEGRAVGNLGNAYTAIGQYDEAVKYHKRRLQIAEEADDLAAKARACGNLGNAFSALGEYTEAIKYYQMSLAVAKESNNVPGQAQAFYCLGSTYTLQKNHVKAIDYHEQHLAIATQLNDKPGMLRAWYCLRNAHHSMGETSKVVAYHKLIQSNQPNKGAPVPTGIPKMEAQPQAPKQQPAVAKAKQEQPSGLSPKPIRKAEKTDKKKPGLFGSKKKNTDSVQAFSASDSDEDDDVQPQRKTGKEPAKEPTKDSAMEWLSAAVAASSNPSDSPAPSPRAPRRLSDGAPVTAPSKASEDTEMDFFDMLVSMQNSRLEDQRSLPPRPSLAPSSTIPIDAPASASLENEDFFDMLVAKQATRIDDQRSPAPAPGSARADGEAPAPRKDIAAKLDADNMSFFEMLAAAKAPN